MSCIDAKGKRFSGPCITCSTSLDPTKCIKCLEGFYPKLTCTTAEYNNCYKPDFDNPCATCQKVSASSYDQCVTCFGKPSSKVRVQLCTVSTAAVTTGCLALPVVHHYHYSDFFQDDAKEWWHFATIGALHNGNTCELFNTVIGLFADHVLLPLLPHGACPCAQVDCESCSVLSSPTSQSSCFKCSAKNPSGSSSNAGGCGLCFTHSKNAAFLNQCLDCLTDQHTTAQKRQVCSLCSSSELTGEQSARCFKCLDGKTGNAGCSTCSTAATTSAAFDACMGCRANANANGPDCHDCDSLGSSLAATARDALRKKCWECVSGSKLVVPQGAGSAPLGSCSSCFASSSADTASCVACNTNPAITTIAKSWCIACAVKPAGEREACMACLASNNKLTATGDYKTKCKI
jgi:hypothetical protein